MPLPTPNKNESKSEFIDRCMADDQTNEDFPDESQRRAVCESQWEKKDMSNIFFNAKGDNAEILIYDDIGEGWFGGISAKSFADEVKKFGKVKNITVRINSYGGSVFDGLAIYNTLKTNSASIEVNIDGIAASIASIIAMAGDTINIASNGFMMIHEPWSVAMGTAEDMRAEADLLDKIRGSLLDTYMTRATAEQKTISDLMYAETWLTAQEAMDYGLVDTMTEEVQIAACANPKILKEFKHAPDFVKPAETPRLDNVKVLSAKMSQALRKRSI